MLGRRVAAATIAIALAVPAPAGAAAPGFDSEYRFQTAFLTLGLGESGTFSVFFINTGTTSWVKGTGTQVDLAACLEDKLTCDQQDPSEARFDPGSWIGRTRYATQEQPVVAPGRVGTFVYRVQVPVDQPPGTYRLNGDLVVRATGVPIHPEGYFHDLTVPAASCLPAAVALSPVFRQRQVGIPYTQAATLSCAGGKPATSTHVTFIVDAAPTDSGNADLMLGANTDANGTATVSWTRTNPGTDRVSVYPTALASLRASATTRWTIALRVLDCVPREPAVQGNATSRTFTVTARNASTGAALASTPLNVTIRTFIPSGTASINNANAARANVGGTVAVVATGPDGLAELTVRGSDATIEPRVFIDEDGASILGDSEFQVDCAATTFG